MNTVTLQLLLADNAVHKTRAGLADLEKTPGLNAATAEPVYDFFHESRAR
ncbi:MAG TPA: hypothetical protein VGG79_16095 [Roseiarcus sp.]